MVSKKKLITGVFTLILGVSVVGAAYALPMNNTPMLDQNTDAAKATVTIHQSGNTAGIPMPANEQTMNSQMSQSSQQMAQHYEQMQQNHHQKMIHNHQAMSGRQPMNSGHRGGHK